MREYIEAFCNEYNYSFFSKYSGRFMYGRQCIGFVCSNMCQSVIELCSYLSQCGVEDYEKELIPVCYDNMGKEMIVYFPTID